MARKIALSSEEGSQTVPQRPPVGESQSDGVIERAAGLVARQVRTLKASLEHRTGTRVPPDSRILCWLVEFPAYRMNRCDIGSDGKTPLHRLHGRKVNTPILFSERRSGACRLSQQEKESGNRDSMLNSSSEAVVVTEQGLAIKTRAANVRRIPDSKGRDADRILGIRAVPWSPDGSDTASDIQVGMERPAEMVPRSLGEVLMENNVARTFLRRAHFERWDLSESCLGCPYMRTGRVRQQAHSEACRRRNESVLRGNSSGSGRLAAADDRINRVLADAVARHATKDPGVRGVLKRSGVLPWDSPPHTPVSHRGSSGSGARSSDTASNDPNTDTGDVTGEERTTQDATRTRSKDHIGGDVAMGGDSADENSAGRPSPSGADSRRRITTKGKPREVRDEQSSTMEQHDPRRVLGKTTPQEHAVAVTTQEALDGYREKTVIIASVENNTLNWVSISSGGALDMTHCDFSVRSARDEMTRHRKQRARCHHWV